MADLESDVVGQVARLPLKPSEANALLPLYEAISNALHAIQDRFGDDKIHEQGRIDIEILRSDGELENPIRGFRVSDNGIGLDEDNYKSFRTPFSQHKMKKGGKGVGRLGWLKVFKDITIDSAYYNGEGLERRSFKFVLRSKDQLESLVLPDTRKDAGTVVTIRQYEDTYAGRCPIKTDTIVQRIIAHFLPIFAGQRSPSIYLHDDGTTELQKVFDSKIIYAVEELIEVSIESVTHPIIIRHMRCDKSIRPRGTQNNWICFCANDRGVKEYGIDEQIGLKLLDGEQIYIGTVTGDYLDSHVNPQRTDFIFDAEEGRAIRRQVATSVKGFLKEYIEESLAQKKAIAFNVIRKNPQYMYLTANIDEFVERLQPNSNNEEQIFLEMSQNRYRRQRHFSGVKEDITESPSFTKAIADKVDDYKKYIQDDQKGTLAEYVTKRKAVLDLLDKLRGFSDIESEKQYLEEAVHSLICPMRIDSDGINIEDHNLWILDDRLAFFRFFASDKPISTYADSASTREPDIAFFYDSCIAWRESERSCDTVILVEFKRPGLETYTDKNDPFIQLMDYVSLFKSGKSIRDSKGKVITGIGHNTSFQCYIVADLTDGLRRRLRGKFRPTPDNKGLFGYTTEPDAYAEVIPYDKLLLDAQARNAIFFDKLGING